MRQPPGESDLAVSDALLPSFSTVASGPQGRGKTLRPAGVLNNLTSPPGASRLPLRPGGRDRGHRPAEWQSQRGLRQSNPALLPWRETEEFSDLLDLDFNLSNSLSHHEPVVSTVSSASASSSSSPSSSGPACAPSTCSFSCPDQAGGNPGLEPGSKGGGLLHGRESAPPATAPFNLADINHVNPSGCCVAELLWPELDPVYTPW
ncbi:hypothetical protein EI555_006846 [Monodon monoceros]|uniref:Uncharacterized protein n=1 Tax=Monodon monoceros TaxID=40151 RepID=A0A4U1EZC9_MONMO|nr:hypothetical protein EI555_006846 [Monodon monoceros]